MGRAFQGADKATRLLNAINVGKRISEAGTSIQKFLAATDDFLNYIGSNIVKMSDGYAFRPAFAGIDEIEDEAAAFINRIDITDNYRIQKIERIANNSRKLVNLDKANEAYALYKAGLKIADNVEIVKDTSSDVAQLTNKLRSDLLLENKIDTIKNVAVSKIKLNGNQEDLYLYAVSGGGKIDKCVDIVKDPSCKLSPVIADKKGRLPKSAADFKNSVFYPRHKDTEVKLLENIREIIKKDFNGQATGEIFLHTRYEPCASCLGVIKEFSELYPNIRLKISWEIKYLG